MTTKTDWNPSLYTRFEDERTRPAIELLARVPHASPARVVDLGCGPGNSTELLVARWPRADVSGVDSSPAMLDAAAERLPGLVFEAGDIATWKPAVPVDVAYANAALQWVPDHERLVPRLLDALAPGGVLAVQMPDNLDEPSHVAMRETAAEPRFAAHLGDAARIRARILPATAYYDLLAPTCDVDVWRTTYHHRMDDAAAIVDWLRATGLKPFVEPLPAELQGEFLRVYQARIEAAYRLRADGHRLLAFPRLFIVARRRG
jgi:trans-aconitate 2-methyltransferase